MKKFHDVKIYGGTELATTGSRLELAANSLFLRQIFSQLNHCEGCREPVVIIFPEEDHNTLREAFGKLSHFKSGLSIIQNPDKVKSLLDSLTPSSSGLATSDFSCRMTPSHSEGCEVVRPSQPNTLSESLERIMNNAWETSSRDQGSENLPWMTNRQVEGEDTEMQELFKTEPGSELVITSVETCLEVPDWPDDENEQIGRRDVKVDLENFDTTQLLICPEIPSASNHKRIALTKEAPTSSVYKILEKKKTSKKGKPQLSCKIEGCKERAYGRSGLYRHYSYAHFKEDILGLIGGKTKCCPYCGLKLQQYTEIVGHVGCVHNKVEDFLPKHLHIKSNVLKKSSKAKAKFKSSYVHVHEANKPDRTKTDYSCGLCEKKFGSRQHLYEHYSLTHYRDQLRPFIDEKSDQCNRCKVIHKNPTEANKIRHMGVVHSLLEKKNILPSHLRIPKISNGVNEKWLGVGKSVSGNKDSTKKAPKRKSPESKLKVHCCHLCPYQNARRSRLYSHYSLSHYKDQLALHIDQTQNTMECPYCGLKKSRSGKVWDLNSLVLHIGSAHNKIENYLPKEFCVQRPSGGNFFKVPSTSDPVLAITEDQDQHQDHLICPETDFAQEETYDLGKTKKIDSRVGEGEDGLRKFVQFLRERESSFNSQDSADEESSHFNS